jgi:hypothetical protein
MLLKKSIIIFIYFLQFGRQGMRARSDLMSHHLPCYEASYESASINCANEHIDCRTGVAILSIVYSHIAPYLGMMDTHFRCLCITYEPLTEAVNGHTQAFRINEETEQGVGVRIVLNSNQLQNKEALMSTFLHELAHVLTFNVYSLSPGFNSGIDASHDARFFNFNILLIKLVKCIPEMENYFDLNHAALNAYKGVTYKY